MILGKPINLPKSHFFTAGTLLRSSVLSSVMGQTVHQEPQRRWDELLNCKDSHVPEKIRVQTPVPGHMLVKVWHFLGEQTVCHSSRKQCPHASPHSHFLTDDGQILQKVFCKKHRVCELRWGKGDLLLPLVLLHCDVW